MSFVLFFFFLHPPVKHIRTLQRLWLFPDSSTSKTAFTYSCFNGFMGTLGAQIEQTDLERLMINQCRVCFVFVFKRKPSTCLGNNTNPKRLQRCGAAEAQLGAHVTLKARCLQLPEPRLKLRAGPPCRGLPGAGSHVRPPCSGTPPRQQAGQPAGARRTAPVPGAAPPLRRPRSHLRGRRAAAERCPHSASRAAGAAAVPGAVRAARPPSAPSPPQRALRGRAPPSFSSSSSSCSRLSSRPPPGAGPSARPAAPR